MIKVSMMSGKLAGMAAINSDPLSNQFCREQRKAQDPDCICTHCFSCRMLKTYRKGCRPSWRANGLLLSLVDFRDQDLPKLPKRVKFCRIHAHGELLNYRHLKNLLRICEVNPYVWFGFWSKREDLVARAHDEGLIPENVSMVYSNPTMDTIVEEPPKGFHKAFNVVRDPEHPGENCAGKKCRHCLRCYRRDAEDVIIEVLRGKAVTDLEEESEILSELEEYF